jgi:prolipoprotein diacylglyceryltransferase
MTVGQTTGAAKAADMNVARIAIGQRAGVWRVTINGELYGDYVRKAWALEAAFEKADELAASGRAATIACAIDGRRETLLYDTRSPAPSRGSPRRRASGHVGRMDLAGRR